MSIFEKFPGEQHTYNTHGIAFSWKFVFCLKLEELIKIYFSEKAKLAERAVSRNMPNNYQGWQQFVSRVCT